MATWRERVLACFTGARLTLVADPDALLADEALHAALTERGFEILPRGDDPVAFRYRYEARYRAAWDAGAGQALLVLVPGPSSELRELPPDLVEAGRAVDLSLAELFPGLAAEPLAELDRADLDRLDGVAREPRAAPMGEDATHDFVLRHVFGIALETLREPHQLLRALLQLHFPGRALPPSLAAYTVRKLRRGGGFPGWPLEEIVPGRDAFLRFLQERWPAFVREWLDEHFHPLPIGERPRVREARSPRYDTIEEVPFGHPDVRVYMDNLFVEGLLEPVEVSRPDVVHERPELRDSWAALGLKLAPADVRHHRMERLLARAEAVLPAVDAPHGHWQAFASLWAEWLLRVHEAGAEEAPFQERSRALRGVLDARFEHWMRHRYGALHNHAGGGTPTMVHHIPRSLSRELGAGKKVALLVIDGLALDQWALLRRVLLAEGSLAVEDGTVFTWIPTLTAVARQALFSGRPPILFGDTIHRTDRDAAAWAGFWAARDVPPSRVRYANALHLERDLGRVDVLAADPGVRVLGLVVDVVDRTMHGMEHGTAGMHAQLRHWTEAGYLKRLLEILLGYGFAVTLTSDHGNVEAEGIGRPMEGASAEVRGERVRVYGDTLLRDRALAAYPGAVAWDSPALPPGYHPLLAPGRGAFVGEGERVVGHGGACLEEVIVPYAKIFRRAG